MTKIHILPNYPYSVVYKTLNSMTDVNPQDNVYVCEEIVSSMVEKVRLNPFITVTPIPQVF